MEKTRIPFFYFLTFGFQFKVVAILMDFLLLITNQTKWKERINDHGCDKVVNTLGNKPVCWDNFSNFSKKNV